MHSTLVYYLQLLFLFVCCFRLAVEEILKDLKRGAERAREHGALGWYAFYFL